MKKKILGLILGLVFLISGVAWGTVGTVTQIGYSHGEAGNRDAFRTIVFTCIGDVSNGSIPNTDISAAWTTYIKGWYLYEVEAYPTSGGTAPDAADVMIYDSDGLDLLGSEDGGTTAYAGLTLVHATLKRSCFPNKYLPRAGLHVNYYPQITGVLTLDVDNQGTASADWTIVLKFDKFDR